MSQPEHSVRPAPTMTVRNQRPPMWDIIDRTFNIGNRPIIFAWGNIIYNPNNGIVTPALMAHEAIHGERQGQDYDGICSWWERYLKDPEFRLDEELPAHRAEYGAFCKRHADRNAQMKYLAMIAARLSGPLYGGTISARDAKERILLP